MVPAAEAVAEALRSLGHDASLLPAPRAPDALLPAIRKSGADRIFNLVEAWNGDPRLEAAAAWMMELSGIPYTGSRPLALSLALEKPLAKAVLSAHGVPVPRGTAWERDADPLPDAPFPWIVKPAAQDASHGISSASVVHDAGAARAQARLVVGRYGGAALVEEFVEGRELNASILGGEVLPLGEIDFSGFPAGRPKLVTYDAKWIEGSDDYRATPPVAATGLSPVTELEARERALRAFRALGLRGYGRVDLRLHPERGPLVLEVNPNPDLSPDAGFARAAARRGLPYAALVGAVLDRA